MGSFSSHAHPSALDGVKVLDFSHALAGPYCTLVLSDYGADVCKVESPDGGDTGRGWAPPFIGDQAAFFLGLNRGKRGLSIDLKQPAGIDLCLRLIDKMDVLVENFRPGTMDRLGLGYDAVHHRNPQLIYCSISGYGQTGPSRDQPAMDLILQASCGLMSITGTEDGELVRCGYSVADVTAGLAAVIGILMALRHRDRTGQGQYVDVAMLDAMISTMTSNYMYHLASGVAPQPLGTGFPTIVPYRVFDAKDRGFALAIGSEKLWASLCDAIHSPDLLNHPDYATNPDRVRHRQALEDLLTQIFRKRPAAAWVENLRSVGIPCSLVRTLPEVVNDPQSAFRNMFPALDQPAAEERRHVTGSPVKMSETPARIETEAPSLGQHTRDTLREILGMDDREIDNLASNAVLFENKRP